MSVDFRVTGSHNETKKRVADLENGSTAEVVAGYGQANLTSSTVLSVPVTTDTDVRDGGTDDWFLVSLSTQGLAVTGGDIITTVGGTWMVHVDVSGITLNSTNATNTDIRFNVAVNSVVQAFNAGRCTITSNANIADDGSGEASGSGIITTSPGDVVTINVLSTTATMAINTGVHYWATFHKIA